MKMELLLKSSQKAILLHNEVRKHVFEREHLNN